MAVDVEVGLGFHYQSVFPRELRYRFLRNPSAMVSMSINMLKATKPKQHRVGRQAATMAARSPNCQDSVPALGYDFLIEDAPGTSFSSLGINFLKQIYLSLL